MLTAAAAIHVRQMADTKIRER
jgi:hypothetical protein